MGYTHDDLNICCKISQLLCLLKNVTTLKLMYILNYLKKPQGLEVYITAMLFMELSKKMKHFTNKHPGSKLNKPKGDAELCAILLPMVPYHKESTNGMSISEVVRANWEKIIDKIEGKVRIK